MIDEARQSGKATEATMWDSIADVDELLEELKETHPDKFWKFVRKVHRTLYGSHYDMQFAMYDIEKMTSTDSAGKKQAGAHWTREQVAEAWHGKTFPAGTTDCDKWVAANAMWHDLHKTFDDRQILSATVLFFFADEDWNGHGKIWEYMSNK